MTCTNAGIVIATLAAENLASLQSFGTIKSDELLNMNDEEWADLIGRLLIALVTKKSSAASQCPRAEDTTSTLETISSWKSLNETMAKFETKLRPYGINAFADMLGVQMDKEGAKPSSTSVSSSWPSRDARLQLLLRFSAALQQQRLEESKSVIKPIIHAEPESVSASVTTSISTVTIIPSHFTDRQREMVMTCYEHLRADYEHRLQYMYRRLNILETDYGVTETASPRPFAPSLLSSFEDLQEILAVPASSSKKSNAVPSNLYRSNLKATGMTDRGGRLDDKESRRVAGTAVWQDGGRDIVSTSRITNNRASRPRNRGRKAAK